MEKAIYTEQSIATIEIYLQDLALNELMQIETGVGLISVRRTHHGAEAWLRLSVISEKEIGVRSGNILEAFIELMEIGQHYIAEYHLAQDEDDRTQAIINRMAPLTPLLVACARTRLLHQLPDVSVLSASFDKTLFVTNTDGSINRQTLHYPLEKEHVYGACDCLRFRGTLRPCEHLVVIAEETLLADSSELIKATA